MTVAKVDLQEQRHAHTVALLEAPGKSLADLSDREFEAGLQRIQLVQSRMQTILATALKKGVHYDNPNNAFQQPILLKAGAEEIRRLMRVRVRRIAEPTIQADDDWVSVTVHVGIFDEMNRMIAERSANCNTKEARFRKRDGGWTYRDPREMVHQCLAMADKRASADLTEEASGATGFFQTERALMSGIEEGSAEVGCSPEEKRTMKRVALEKKLTKQLFFELVIGATGRPMGPDDAEPFVTSDEVPLVLDAIAMWAPREPVRTESRTTAPLPDHVRQPSAEDELFGGRDA